MGTWQVLNHVPQVPLNKGISVRGSQVASRADNKYVHLCRNYSTVTDILAGTPFQIHPISPEYINHIINYILQGYRGCQNPAFPSPPLLSSPLLASHFFLPHSLLLFSSLPLFSHFFFFIFFLNSCNFLFLTFLLGSLSCFLFLHKNNRNFPCVCLRSSPISKNVLDKLLPVGEMPTFEVHPYVWRHCLQKLFMKMWVIPTKWNCHTSIVWFLLIYQMSISHFIEH